ncbi:MAG: hypothetical protein QXH42_03600 [Thermoplasmata archaeon]
MGTGGAAGHPAPPTRWGLWAPPPGYPGYLQPSGMSREEEERSLTEELSALEERVAEIKKRLEELRK